MAKLHALALTILMASGLTTVAVSQDKPVMDHSKMNHGAMSTPAAAGDSPSTKAYKAANERMHKDMAIAFTGDVDQDFVKGMLPHHQGAVEMAKIVLQYGKDPKIRKLARDIVKAQQAEIAFMTAWQKAKAK